MTKLYQDFIPSHINNVDRATSELRRGGIIIINDNQINLTILAAENINPKNLDLVKSVLITHNRAIALKLCPIDQPRGTIKVVSKSFTLAQIHHLINPLAPMSNLTDCHSELAKINSLETATISLLKISKLMPAALIMNCITAPDTPVVKMDNITRYYDISAQTLSIVSQAQVSLKNAPNAKIVAFRPIDGGIEHLAIIIGEPDPNKPILTRLHSECFTGDLLDSLRCDCGDQLRGAISAIAAAGSGILLYLAQEGRGIGLINKLRAYQLQDQGFDTLDANLQLGFDEDERLYQPCAQMLKILGFHKIRLMTNNPNKISGLTELGIEITERVPHIFQPNEHNKNYLKTKAEKAGHLF